MSQDHPPTTRVEVSDFGPIVRADVDMRPLTVFVGPSNTGKSYLAMLVYALHRFATVSRNGFGLPLEGFRRSPKIDHASAITEEDVDALEAWISDIPRSGRPNAFVPLPVSIASLIRPLLACPQPLGERLDAEIASCLGFADTKAVMRHGSTDGTAVSVRTRLSSARSSSQFVQYRYSMRAANEPALTGDIPEVVPLKALRRQLPHLLRRMRYLLPHRSSYDSLAVLADAVFPYTVGVFGRRAYYLPAGRTGIMRTHSIVVRALIGQATYAGLRKQVELPMLSGVEGDFLAQLIDLSSRKTERLPRKLDRRLEVDVLGGSVHAKKSESNYPLFSYQPRGWTDQLSLMNASSMVSELAPIALYLRHVVRRGEVLIIEEPESHLHPARQVKLARFLCQGGQSRYSSNNHNAQRDLLGGTRQLSWT